MITKKKLKLEIEFLRKNNQFLHDKLLRQDKRLEPLDNIWGESAMKLMDYLHKNPNSEFRLVSVNDGSAYIHPLGKDGETFDFYIGPTTKR